MATEYYDSVWDAIEETTETSCNMRLRSDLLMKIANRVREWGVDQKEARHRLGITQARLSDLLSGRINQFNLNELLNLAKAADLKIEVTTA
jgi:predicted XRE-type DNA-binding protein